MEKMRLLALVDMYPRTRHERKADREFKEHLFECGFSLLQEGVYSRIADGRSQASLFTERLKACGPEFGTVRLFTMTERQFQTSLLLAGTKHAQETEIDSQLDIFL